MGCYIIYDTTKDKLLAISDSRTMVNRYLLCRLKNCENIRIKEVTRTDFDKIFKNHEDCYIVSYYGLPVLCKYLKIVNESIGSDKVDLICSYIGLMRLIALNCFSDKERKTLCKSVKIIEKMLETERYIQDSDVGGLLEDERILDEILELKEQFDNRINDGGF